MLSDIKQHEANICTSIMLKLILSWIYKLSYKSVRKRIKKMKTRMAKEYLKNNLVDKWSLNIWKYSQTHSD